MTKSSSSASPQPRRHSAGAFDIRNVIGALLGIYGILLLIAGFFMNPGWNYDAQEAKNSVYNIWTAVALLIVAIVFFTWSKLRPIVVDEAELAQQQEGASH